MRVKLLIVLILLIIPSTAFANGMTVEVINIPGSTIIYPNENSPLEVVEEELIFEINTDNGQVTARYLLSNPTSQQISTDVVFFVPKDALDPQVFLNEQSLPVEWIEQYSKRGVSTTNWINPLTEKVYLPNHQHRDYQSKSNSLFLFNISIEEKSQAILEVTYTQYPSTDYRFVHSHNNRYDYFLWPAEYWSSFGTLDIFIKIQKNQVLTTNLGKPEMKDGYYYLKFTDIPDDYISIYVMMKPLGIAGNWLNHIYTSLEIRIIILTVLAIMGGLITRRTRKDLRIGVIFSTLIILLFLTPGNLLDTGKPGILLSVVYYLILTSIVLLLGLFLNRRE